MSATDSSSEAVWPSPLDAHNRRLIEHTHPGDWKNPKPSGRYNLVVIGGGPAGLVTAAGAAGLGAKVALIERQLLGGDCLNVGCVPSKTLLASARMAAAVARSKDLGVECGAVTVNFEAVMERVRRIRADLSPHDSARRFTDLGVDVFLGAGTFRSADSIEVAGERLSFSRAVIATGARAALPAIPGLSEAAVLTNETLFNLTELPPRLVVVGGGPIGCELAQAFQRLGSRVTLLQDQARLLHRDDPAASQCIHDVLVREGVDVRLQVRCLQILRAGEVRTVVLEQEGRQAMVQAEQILVAAGRAPNVEGLGLESAGVTYSIGDGVRVNDFLQTNRPHIYACGDVCMSQRFTHAADFAARMVIQNALFSIGPLGKRRLSSLRIPWCTYTDPEVAHVGMHEDEAKAGGIEAETFITSFDKLDRAITDGDTDGFVKITVQKKNGILLGATIVGSHAGDLIAEISTAMAGGVSLGRLASVIHAYPTRADALRKCGDVMNRGRLTPGVRSAFASWLRWQRRG